MSTPLSAQMTNDGQRHSCARQSAHFFSLVMPPRMRAPTSIVQMATKNYICIVAIHKPVGMAEAE